MPMRDYTAFIFDEASLMCESNLHGLVDQMSADTKFLVIVATCKTFLNKPLWPT